MWGSQNMNNLFSLSLMFNKVTQMRDIHKYEQRYDIFASLAHEFVQ